MSYSPSDSTLEIAPPSALELLWINNRTLVIGGIASLIVISLIAFGVLAANHASQIASETTLSNATDAAGFQEVIAKYPHSKAAANAMLLLAASLRDKGKIDDSNALYSRFVESFPNSSLVVSGMIGRASNDRISNHPEAALTSYQEAASAYPQSYGAPFALFSEVQILAQSGKSEEAKRILQTLLTQYSGSASAQAFGGGQPAPRSSENSTTE